MHLTLERRQRTQAFCGLTSMCGREANEVEDESRTEPTSLGGDAAAEAGEAECTGSNREDLGFGGMLGPQASVRRYPMR